MLKMKSIAFTLLSVTIVSLLTSCTLRAITDVSDSPSSDIPSVEDDVNSFIGFPDYISDTSTLNIYSVVFGNFEKITSDFSYSDYGLHKTEEDIIKAYPAEFNEIIGLGNNALPALNEIMSSFDMSDAKYAFANYLVYKIKPDLYEKTVLSPDKKFSVVCSTDTFLNSNIYKKLYNKIKLIDTTTNETVLFLRDDNEYEISVDWSPDDKYVAIAYHTEDFCLKTIILDIKNVKIIELPTYKMVKDALNFDSIYQYKSLGSQLSEWYSDDIVEIKIYTVLLNTNDFYGRGWYIFDLINEQITDGFYEVVEDLLPPT